MPTLKGVDVDGNCEKSKYKSNIIFSYYYVEKKLFPQLWQDKLFPSKNQWLASRSIHPANNSNNFQVRLLSPAALSVYVMCGGSSGGVSSTWISRAIRPVTTLKLDSSAIVTKENGAWKITAK